MNNSGHPESVLRQKQIEIIRDSAVKAEKDGKLTKAQTGLISDQSWYKIFVPVSVGGSQLPIPEIVQLFEALAWADGSFGWTVTKCALAGWNAGFLNTEVVNEMLAGDKVYIAGSGAATGTAEKTKSGYTINGKWSHVAGAGDATAFILNCVVTQNGTPLKDDTNKVQVLSFLFPKSDVTIDTAWVGMGLVATGSHDIELKNIKVTADRSFKTGDGNAVAGSRVYQFPSLQLSEASLAVSVSGMTFHFIELCRTLLNEKKGPNGATLITDNMVDDTLEKYTQKMNDARVKLYYALELSWQACMNGQAIKDTILYKVSAAAQDLTRKSRECADALYPFCGVGAMDRLSEINRVWRDLHTASQDGLLVFGGM